jgi:ribosomal protein S18 acetylase RimI-like enzyme
LNAMRINIERLDIGDEARLEFLALHDADFDLDDETASPQPLEPEAAKRYLENPAVLHWVAVQDQEVLGFLVCNVLGLRSGKSELLLYEIGVHRDWRRHGIGNALIQTMKTWMRKNEVVTVWVLGDNEGAVEFYRSSGFEIELPQPRYMLLQT